MLDDSFLDFLKTVVMAFENFSRSLDIDALLLFGLPREVEDEVEIVPDNGALVVVRAPCLQFPCLRKRLLLYIVGHLPGLDLFPVTVIAGIAFALVQLVLDQLQLLSQDCLPVRLANLVGDFLSHLHPDADVLAHPDEEFEERDVPLADRDDFKECLFLRKGDRQEWHDEPHDLVSRVHLVDRLGELLRAGEPAAGLMDGEFYIRKDPGLKVGLDVEDIRDRLERRVEHAVSFGDGGRPHPPDDLDADEVPVIRGFDPGDPEQVSRPVQRFGRHFKGACPAPDGQPDRPYCSPGFQGFKQEFSGRLVDIEFCPAVRVDHNLEERYDNRLV